MTAKKFHVIQVTYLALLAALLPLPVSAESDLEVRKRIRADYAALEAAESDYRQRWSRGYLSPQEAADYRGYIDHLRHRFLEGCMQLPPGDRTAPIDDPCPTRAPTAPFAASIDLNAERTLREHAADLDRALNTALSEFDDMLLREQEQVKATRPTTGAGAAGAQGRGDGGARAGSSGQQEGDQQGGGAAGRTASSAASEDGETSEVGGTSGSAGPVTASTGDGGDVPRAGSGRLGREQQAGVQGRPPDIPDGSDDDIVARQLREAAENETDPELKKRLWEEYRKYKQGTR